MAYQGRLAHTAWSQDNELILFHLEREMEEKERAKQLEEFLSGLHKVTFFPCLSVSTILIDTLFFFPSRLLIYLCTSNSFENWVRFIAYLSRSKKVSRWRIEWCRTRRCSPAVTHATLWQMQCFSFSPIYGFQSTISSQSKALIKLRKNIRSIRSW